MSKTNKIMGTTENTGKRFIIDDELCSNLNNDFIGGSILNIDLDETKEILEVVSETGTVTHQPFSRCQEKFNYLLAPKETPDE